MQDIPEIWPDIAWDGHRHVAFAMPDATAGTVVSLTAHGPETSECAAVWEAEAGLAVALIPPLARHLDLIFEEPSGRRHSFAIELDGQLLPAMADLAQPGLSSVILESAQLRFSRHHGLPDAGTVSLNLAASGPSGHRIKIGPLVDVAADTTVTTVSLLPEADGVTVALHRPGGRSPLLIADIPALPDRLQTAAQDITGASGADAAERGFRLEAAADTWHWQGRNAHDSLLLLAPRGHRIGYGESARPGTRLKLTRDANGAVTAELTRHAYRPATSTALAALGGGRGKALTVGGSEAVIDAADDAASLAEAWWKRARSDDTVASPELAALADRLEAPARFPMAKLTLSARHHADSGVAPLTAAMGEALSLPPGMIEDLEALSAPDRAMLAQWTARAPDTALLAIRARILPDDSMAGTPGDAVKSSLLRAVDSGFARAMSNLAERLAAKVATPERRGQIALLQDMADTDRTQWLPFAGLREAVDLLAANPAPTPSLSPAAQLIADLKRDQKSWGDAQQAAQAIDLAIIAERRAMIPLAAVGAGVSEETAADLDARIAALSSAEILLLHGHLTSSAKRQALVRAVKRAVTAMDEAAQSKSLASRMDRSGDPLLGMTRIGSAAETVVREIVRLPQARDALVALTTWINACLPPAEANHALSEQLVRNLKSYGCFLLMNAVAAECRVALGDTGESAQAFAKRLMSGLAESLPRLVATATARGGDDISLGLAFTGRLPPVHEMAAQ